MGVMNGFHINDLTVNLGSLVVARGGGCWTEGAQLCINHLDAVKEQKR